MNIFPIIDPQASGEGQNQALPLCKEAAWDFERDVPVFKNGRLETVTGREAVKVWIWKALHTRRCRYEIYSRAYGSGLESLTGQGYSDAVKTAEAPRYLEECLLASPYVRAVRDISVAFGDAGLAVAGTAVTVYGEVQCHADV